jgi:hypothetical protein
METRINLCPDEGAYQTPLMTTVKLAGMAQYPDAVILEFLATSESPGTPTRQLSIAVPLPKIQASGLLRSLKMLQERGLIPFVPEANPTQN